MFFAPKEIKKETGESFVYNPTVQWFLKSLLLMLLTISLIMKANANHFMAEHPPSSDCSKWLLG